jgi:hypothetical protein
LDFDRFGIVAQSRIWPHKRGGALPNTQVFISEIEQYRQAREVNARIAPGEPHDLFRHELTKYVEQGETWLPYGTREDTETAWWRDVALGARITARARALIAQALPPFDAQSRSLPDDLIPCPIEGVAVRLYQSGLVAYGSALGQSLDAALLHACTQASTDPRLLRDIEPASCAIVVSILHHQEPLGFTSISMAGRKLRRGLDALGITGAGHTAILLPSVLSYNNLSREDFVKTAALYAGLEREAEACQVKWSTFQCAEWMEAGERSFPLRFGFPDRTINGESNVGPDVLIRSLGTYIAQSVNADGLPRYLLLPATNDAQQYGTAGRAIHALMALDLAAEFLNERTWLDIVEAGLRYCLEHVRDGTIMLPHCAGGTLADAVLLSAVARHSALAASAPTRSIVHRLHQMLRPYGRFGSVFRRLDLPEDHEFLPGAALAGLGHYAAVDRYALPPSLSKQIAWYSYRFSVCPGWGSAGWLPQGMQAVHRVTADSEAMQLAFSATDWCIERQLASTGAFLEDLSPYEPSFNTGFIAEGVAASWAIALEIGDTDRASRYAASWSNAMRFMKRLIVFPEDVFAMRAGSKAVGGVRCMMSRSDIRIDQVSHCLHALITGVRLEYRMGELLQKTINGLDYAAQAD